MADNPISSIFSGLGSGDGGSIMEGLFSSGGSSPLSALSGGMEGGMGAILDPIGALAGDSLGPLKYILMPHTLITDAISGNLSGGESFNGIATLLGGVSA